MAIRLIFVVPTALNSRPTKWMLHLAVGALTLLSALVNPRASHAAAQVPDEVQAQAAAGQVQDVIVLFKSQDIVREAELQRPPGAQFDDTNVQAVKAAGFATRRENVLTPIPLRDVQQVQAYSNLPMSHVRLKSLAGLSRLANNPQVEAIYPNEKFGFALAQSLPLIHQPPVAQLGLQGAGTTVAVIDTGADYTNAAFGCTAPGVPTNCRVAFAQDFTPVDDGFRDDNGHGTNVSGIVVGVAPKAKIAALDVFDGASASTTTIVQAVNWVIANKASFNIVAMNLSLGGNQGFTAPCGNNFSPLETAFAQARAVGVVPVVASGNNNFHDRLAHPACVPGAVSVGAVYDSDILTAGNFISITWGVAPNTCTDFTTLPDQVTCFSNGASYLSILAPGGEITAAGLTEGGTSQATPHVAGALAVLRAPNVGATDTLDATVNRLVTSGRAIIDNRDAGFVSVKPRLDLQAAVATLPDADADGVIDAADNCVNVSNANQRDTNGDGYGNICDADLNNDNIVNISDLALFRAAFGTADPDADFTNDGVVNISDLATFKSLFNNAPGPSGLHP